jgi:hypothetical protein
MVNHGYIVQLPGWFGSLLVMVRWANVLVVVSKFGTLIDR